MTHPNLDDLCQPPTLKASSQTNAAHVYDLTCRLNEPVQSILSTLNRRAMALTKSANFESALRDANVMQQLSTFSPLGYLRAAEVYSEQGKQRHVIDICNQGLAVIDRMDPYYDTLQRIKMDAEQRHSNRIDFIQQLPADIVITTLVPMLMDDKPLDPLKPCPYLYVSNLWRDRIIQCFGGLHFKTGLEADERDINTSLVAEFARHTKEFEIAWYSGGTWLPDMLQENDFRMLQTLAIDGHFNHGVDRFVSSLHSIGNTLTDLNLGVHSGPTPGVFQIMMACPNLVSLFMYHANDLHTISRITKTWPKLRRLAIYEIQDGITPDTVLAISQRFPSLSRLYLHPWNVESALVVPQCYPRMNTVELAMDDAGLEGGYYEGDGCKQHAITRFTIEEQHEGENTCENLSALLKQNHTTIETMTWDINPHSDDHELYDIQYPLLKQLTLGLSGWWIPQKSPMLQELKIDSRTLSVSAAVFDCIPPNLKKLEFNLSIGEQLDDKTPIAHYLKRLSQHPLLNELVIHFDRSFDIDNVLDAIVCLARLVRLTINLPPATNSSRVQRFLEELTNGCPYLRCLEMKCGHSPTSILALRLLKHLKYLAISVEHPFYPFNYNGFWDDVKELSRLNAFQVTRNMVDNMDDIGYLKAQRPDLKIFVDKRFTRF